MFRPSARFSPTHVQAGASLVEVLVAVVVSGVGLLGMAGLLGVSSKANASAYSHTQITLAAQSLIGSMQVNRMAVAGGAYNGSYSGTVTSDRSCVEHACAPTQRAVYDLSRFQSTLGQSAAEARATLSCSASTATSGYDGLCKLLVRRSERALSAGGATGGEILAWVFQP